MRDPLNTPEMRELDGKLDATVRHRAWLREHYDQLRTIGGLLFESAIIAGCGTVALLASVPVFFRVWAAVIGAIVFWGLITFMGVD